MTAATAAAAGKDATRAAIAEAFAPGPAVSGAAVPVSVTPSLLAALIRFLEAHEPDLIDVAKLLNIKPELLIAARSELER